MGTKVRFSEKKTKFYLDFSRMGVFIEAALQHNEENFRRSACLFRKFVVLLQSMIELSRHIEILLLKNECVIVPDFGGFMTHHVCASYSEQEHLFLPPMRTLGFNPQLRMNDSVLVQSYVEAYDISYPEALRRIEEEVEEVKEVLSQKGTYTMNDLGELTINQEGNMEFTPCQAGILSPELYGLADFSFKTLKNSKLAETTAEVTELKNVKVEEKVEDKVEDQQEEKVESPTLLDFTGEEAEEENDSVNIKMSWIRNVGAVAAAIVAFFLLSTPVVNSELGTSTMTNLQNHILYKLIPQDTNVMKAEPVEAKIDNKIAVKEVVADKDKETAQVNEKKADSIVTKKDVYMIIVASQVKKSNAENYVEQLHKNGYPQAEIFIHNNVVRVTCGQFDTEAEAYKILNKMTSKEEFADAWVFKKKA